MYVCYHEAGHAAAAYIAGGYVDQIELLPESHPLGRARATTFRPPGSEKMIACGAFAVEYLLYQAGRITDEHGTAITEKGFIDASMANASADKKSFFGEDLMQFDGTWPADADRQYMSFGIFVVVPKLAPMLNTIAALAERLLSTGRIERSEIESILGPISK